MRIFALGQFKVSLAVFGIALLFAAFPSAAQSEGQALHVFVGKSVVINLQSPVTRILSSNPTVVDTLATSPTQIVVEGKAAGSSSLIIWDATGHSQMLDVTVDVNISRLRTAIEETYPGQPITVQSDGAHLIFSGELLVGAFAPKNVEVIEPEVGHHFLELTFTGNSPHDLLAL